MAFRENSSSFQTPRRWAGLSWLLRLSYPERIVAYICLANFLTKLIFELALGMWWYKLSTTILFMFVCFLSLDHAVWLARGQFRGVPADRPLLITVLIWLVMTVHGVLIGILQNQSTTTLVIDTVPVLLALISIVRFGLMPKINFFDSYERLKHIVFAAAIANVAVGFVAVSMGLPSRASPGSHVFAFMAALQFVTIAKMSWGRRFWIEVLVFWGIFAASIEDINRSTLATIGGLFLLSLILRMRFDIRGGIAGLLMAALFPFILFSIVPEGSKTYVRLNNMINGEQTESSVSLNSRKLEKQQITAELERGGGSTKLLGLGHGGTYEFNVYGDVDPNHSNAHYASAYMMLRYGMLGSAYLYAIAASLLLGLWVSLRNGSNMALFIGALNLTAFIYLFTWVYFLFFCMGLTYFIYAKNLRQWKDPARPSKNMTDEFGQLTAKAL
mgnify:CR=1 FL=1